VGEIRVRPRREGVLSAAYEGDLEATLAVNAGGWFRTGDLGRLDDDGFVYFVDRLKHVIRRRGENISSWELENLVLEHPLVEECCAIGVPSPLGEDDVKIVVGVTGGMARLPPAGLWAWCEERMARFMVPTHIQVVERLPRAPTGKVLKEELRDVSGDVWEAQG
jgi:crotonobetaine/carnitine-CoA ligase